MEVKTPEQMAEEYRIWVLENDHREVEKPGGHLSIAFLAGYKAAKNSPENSDSSDDSDTPDLQEQLEALHQYMTVAQRKIMALQANVEFLLYHNKEKIGESETIRRMQQTMQGFGRKDE